MWNPNATERSEGASEGVDRALHPGSSGVIDRSLGNKSIDGTFDVNQALNPNSLSNKSIHELNQSIQDVNRDLNLDSHNESIQD